jgi:hypothetical protein
MGPDGNPVRIIHTLNGLSQIVLYEYIVKFPPLVGPRSRVAEFGGVRGRGFVFIPYCKGQADRRVSSHPTNTRHFTPTQSPLLEFRG